MKTNFEQLKENAAKELITLAAKIQQAKTFEKAQDTYENFCDTKWFKDIAKVYICDHCPQYSKDTDCDCQCNTNCEKWLNAEAK